MKYTTTIENMTFNSLTSDFIFEINNFRGNVCIMEKYVGYRSEYKTKKEKEEGCC